MKTSPTFTFGMSFVQEKCQKQTVDGLIGHPVECRTCYQLATCYQDSK